ncbi:probable aspartyl aminopeptidase isoform X2 [Amborella trichopoda]|uniref:probable aspartyl aminopeptidase isoform X2 n=1 Tax=Amborella trichopoda TaxID=13333 RepID=UPI0009C08BF9|nr:probable aspartyl aminopeptidase isoform X2 [Amborella trichopoda]|eukprot:XP_020517999.1 probable aspartyl aminopeptidase isoform X2 [Amborella trichopoda]
MAMAETPRIASDLIDFLNASPTAFHAVDEAKKLLKEEGFQQLSERDDWSLSAGGKYFFTRNHSTIVAFVIGESYVAGNGFHIIGAHTDSPCLKLKPISKVTKGGYLEVGVQTYGGGLWHTWFDRDLTVAGRMLIKKEKDGHVSYVHRLVRIEEPILRIPTLAIHLDRTVTEGFKVNTQNQLVPVLATAIKSELLKVPPESDAIEGRPNTDGNEADEKKNSNKQKHHPLLLMPSIIGGAAKEFMFSGRLDNLCMSFCSLRALFDSTAEGSLANETGVRMVALFDHEEVGSDSAQGAGSPIILDALARITNSFCSSGSKVLEKAVQRSFLVSADMAHALHPNYMDKHEENHQPRLHGGLVIKHNANQRYASNSVTSFIFREIAKQHKLPVQEFVVRNDMACGSTIGPILASGVGIRTVDVGAPQLSMHSIREMCSVDDVKHSYEHFKAFFHEFAQLDAKISVDV